MSDRGDTPAAEAAAAAAATIPATNTTTTVTTTTSAATATATETESNAPVTRYTYQVLMSLRDSPLVAKPPDMPPLSTWFGDDLEAPLSKGILNGAITSRTLANSLDRNVLLAPNKSIFSAQNYGKRSLADDDSNTSMSTRTTQSHTSSRYRHNNDELRPYNSNGYNNSNNHNNDRDQRSSRSQTYSTEWGLSNRYNNRRVNNKNQHRSISPLQNTKQQQQHHQQDRNLLNESSRNRRENPREKTSTNKLLNGDATLQQHHQHQQQHQQQQQQQRSSDKLPEWMDYNPSTERKPVRQLDAIPPAPPPGFSNDLEAWKSDMKLRDKNMEANGSSQPPLHGKDGQPKKDVSDLDMLLGGMSSIDLHKPQQQQSGGMDFLSSSVLDSPSLPGRRERGSRFAKFFAKREEEATTPVVEELTSQPPTVPVQGKSISINDLFGRNLPQTPPQQQQRQQQGSSEVKASFSQGPPAPAPAPRMLSEEEVLQSLGAKRSPQQHKEKPSAEDAMGFDKVLQILSQPKPTSPYDIKKDEFVEQQESGEPVMVAAETPKQEQHNFEENVYMSSPKPPFELSQQQRASPVSAAIPTATHEEATVASPVRTPAEKQHMRTDSTDSAQAQKPKLVGKAFAGNLPTSVLRQMSARTSEGRSPSIASSKSANRSFAAGSSSAGGSPALSNHSPSAIKSGIPMVSHQQSNSPVQQLSYTSNAYQQPQQRMPATSPGYPLPGHSPIVDPIAAAGAPPLGRQPRNLEQLLQYGVATAAAGNGGGGDKLSPPVMPRSGMNGNGPMMGPHHPHHQPHHPPHPHHPFQGQGGMEQFIPPHLMQPMPPHMGPVGPGPMLQPHHLPPQLQGQAPHQFPPMQREMMTPPTSDHPAYMGNVPPPHMMGNGLPPHLFAKSQGWDRH